MAVDTTRYDFKLDQNGDLFISSVGDFVLTPSDEQHIQDAIAAGPAWWKQNPNRGVNIGSYQNGSFDKQSLEKKIRLELSADNYNSIPAIKYSTDGTLVINPNVNL